LKPQIIFWGTGVIVWVVAQSIVGRMPHIVYNERLAFSIVWPNAWIIPTVILFLVGIVWWFYRFRPTWPWASLSFGLILGGGASNLFERITNAGLVADYWDMYSFFTFNLADVSIAIGIVGLMIYFLHVRA
jgi:signal peptidase II